jgi:hypothetical protein
MRTFSLLIILSMLLAWSCFQTRPVEPPSASNSDWVSPTDYNILLDNFKRSIAQRNVQNYLQCFDQESFRFIAAASLFNDNESVWQNWRIQDEQAYLENLFALLTSQSGNSLNLLETDLQDVTADSLRFVGDYNLRIQHPDTTMTSFFKGQIQFQMQINTFNEWSITRWQDIETHPDSSWSLLKLRYIQ